MNDISKDETSFGQKMPSITTEVPGDHSVGYVERLKQTEIPAITMRRQKAAEESGTEEDPIVWHRAKGANIEDVDGNRYVDLTSGFGVASIGHAAPEVSEALSEQAHKLIHQMGDVYPSDVKIEFCEKLAEITPGSLQQSILGLSGSDAVQAALKTAVMHTGKSGVLSFWNAYHGLEYGTLEVTGYKDAFREPFRSQMGLNVSQVPYPDPFRPAASLASEEDEQAMLDRLLSLIDESLRNASSGVEDVGAILVEPIQGRGGVIVPPDGFLQGLRDLCDMHDLVLIVDEIYTGFGRTGDWFNCKKKQVTPDILCLGKGMGGGLPVSAAIGKSEVMESWGLSDGEALHTSTFLGNPMGCVAGLEVIDKLSEGGWFETVQQKGTYIEKRLAELSEKYPEVIGDVRGEGMMRAIELVEADDKTPDPTLQSRVLDECLKHGYLGLPSGSENNVISLTPPFIIGEHQMEGFFETLDEVLNKLVS